MTHFFSQETSLKLYDAGCVSLSTTVLQKGSFEEAMQKYQLLPLLHPYDFLAETEQAENNRKIVWGEDHPNYGDDGCRLNSNHKENRINMLFSSNPEQYLLDTWVLK